MRLRWILPLTILIPLSLSASEVPAKGRVETILIDPSTITPLHLRPGFISTIRMPEEINSVALGSRKDFSADHSEGEPLYVYVKPITEAPAESDLIIATKSGLHVTLELVSSGIRNENADIPIDFLLEYRLSHSFLISGSPESMIPDSPSSATIASGNSGRAVDSDHPKAALPTSELDLEYELQTRINAPEWSKSEGQQIETAIGDIRQWGNRTAVSYAIYNASDHPLEIVPPQVQIAEHRQKKKKKGPNVISDQLEIRDFRLSKTRLGPGERADGVVVFDRPNFKQSSEKLFLQIAQADQVDRPILIRLPFTPPLAGAQGMEGAK
jgi:hypothetical protein